MKNIFIALVTLTIISCNKEKSTEPLETKQEALSNELSFDKLKDTKWIIGEVGLNGEMPDTIIFDKPDKLTYISIDMGKETLPYSLKKDTIIFISRTFETDFDSDAQINCEQKNRLLFLNTKMKYIYYDNTCSNAHGVKRVNLEENNLYFRRIN